MSSSLRLDLKRIETSLRAVQSKLDLINAAVGSHRDPMDRRIIENMLAGYACVERLVDDGIDLFALGQHQPLLELNSLVLCGTDSTRRAEYAAHRAATERRFYEEANGGIEDVVEWIRFHPRRTVWDRAAGVYLRILNKPQLFIEGNHRTGALIVSYMLLREGHPPFVLTVGNAIDYFSPSFHVLDIRKHSLAALMRLPRVRKRFARFLMREASSQYLLPSHDDNASVGSVAAAH